MCTLLDDIWGTLAYAIRKLNIGLHCDGNQIVLGDETRWNSVSQHFASDTSVP